MTYRITGLDPAAFAPLHQLADDELAQRSIVRMTIDEHPGAPCRVTLDDVPLGETVLLLNHQSVAAGPYRASHAIFVSAGATAAAVFDDQIPPALARRVLSLRAFAADEDMRAAVLAQPGEADGAIRTLLADPEVAYIHAHYATRGCFAARVERT